MRSPLSLTTAACAALFVFLASSPDPGEALQKVLIYTGIGPDGYAHPSIPMARQAIKSWAKKEEAFDVVLSDDPSKFERRDWLMQFDALVFVSTAGGGFMGVHEATDCLYKVPWYRVLIGTTFNYHPQRQEFTVDVHHRSHPSVKHLGKTWKITDEIYNFNIDPRKFGNTVVLSADESTYVDGVESKADRAAAQGPSHPLAWYREGNLLTGSEAHTDDDDDDDNDKGHHRKDRRATGNSTQVARSKRQHHHHHHKRSGSDNHRLSIMEHARRAADDDGNSDTGADDDGKEDDNGAGTVNFAESTGPGRSFYTGLGHGDNMWKDEDFLKHVGGAIQWLLASPTISSNAENDELPGSAYLGPPVVDDSAPAEGEDESGTDSGSGNLVNVGVGFVGYNGSAAAASSNSQLTGGSTVLVGPSIFGSFGAATVALFAGWSFFGL
ncbi:unnamed protein product [Tilletia controversa]|nr:unnamed protein product [Tilletia controversa]